METDKESEKTEKRKKQNLNGRDKNQNRIG